MSLLLGVAMSVFEATTVSDLVKATEWDGNDAAWDQVAVEIFTNNDVTVVVVFRRGYCGHAFDLFAQALSHLDHVTSDMLVWSSGVSGGKKAFVMVRRLVRSVRGVSHVIVVRKFLLAISAAGQRSRWPQRIRTLLV